MTQLEAGTVLGPFRFGPITMRELMQWAEASGDYNPLHIDPEAARAQGFPNVLVSGAFKISLIYRMLEETAGPAWRVKRLACRNTDVDLPPCTLTIEGRVEEPEDVNGGERRVAVRVVNQDGKVTVVATAGLERVTSLGGEG